MLMRNGSYSPPGPRSLTTCLSSANATSGSYWPSTRPTTTDDDPIAAASSAHPVQTTRSPTFPRSGSSAGPSSAASSTNTSGPRRSPGQGGGRVLEPRKLEVGDRVAAQVLTGQSQVRYLSAIQGDIDIAGRAVDQGVQHHPVPASGGRDGGAGGGDPAGVVAQRQLAGLAEDVHPLQDGCPARPA